MQKLTEAGATLLPAITSQAAQAEAERIVAARPVQPLVFNRRFLVNRFSK